MDRLIYTAVSGLSASMVRQRMIASNMANAQTIGFRAEVLTASPMTLTDGRIEVRAFGQALVKGASMKAGSMTQTGRALDVACGGEALLAVQAPDGGEAYTRRGDLTVTATGVLQNGDGLPLIGDAGPVTVPLGATISIGPDGSVLASDPAAPGQPPAAIARLKLASWRGSQLEKGLDGLFRVPAGGALPNDEEARLMTGTLEQSNVDPSDVLVEMVEAQRLFDIRAKTIATARDLDEASAGLMRIDS